MKTRHSRIKGKRRTIKGAGWFSSENSAVQPPTSGNSAVQPSANSVTDWFSGLWTKSTNPSTTAVAPTSAVNNVQVKPAGGKRRSKKSASRR